MRHEYRLDGHRYALRPVAVEDAAYVVGLRTDPRLSRYINATSGSIADQVQWLERYFERPGDWYFVVVDRRTTAPAGVIAVYDHDPEHATAEWGRWIVPDAPLGALESALLIYRFAFATLGLRSVYSRTVADNGAVVSFHESCGARRVRVLPGYAAIGAHRYDSVEHAVDRADWAGMEPRLAALAQRGSRAC